MNHVSRRFHIPTSTSVVLVAGSLLLISISKPVHASGYYMYSNATPSSVSLSPPNPGTSRYLTPGQTSTASSSAYYAATATSQSVEGFAIGNISERFVWINNGNSPYPIGSFTITVSGSVSGSTTSNGGATASSGTGIIGPNLSAPPAYSKSPRSSVNSADRTGQGTLNVSPFGLSVDTTAGPDNSADPSKEQYGQPTAASATAQMGVTVTQDTSYA